MWKPWPAEDDDGGETRFVSVAKARGGRARQNVANKTGVAPFQRDRWIDVVASLVCVCVSHQKSSAASRATFGCLAGRRGPVVSSVSPVSETPSYFYSNSSRHKLLLNPRRKETTSSISILRAGSFLSFCFVLFCFRRSSVGHTTSENGAFSVPNNWHVLWNERGTGGARQDISWLATFLNETNETAQEDVKTTVASSHPRTPPPVTRMKVAMLTTGWWDSAAPPPDPSPERYARLIIGFW